MEDEGLLDMSQEILVTETQDDDFPATFSKNIVKKLGIRQTKRGTEAVITNNNRTDNAIDEAAGPSNSDVASSLEKTSLALEEHLNNPLRQIFKEKAKATTKCAVVSQKTAFLKEHHQQSP